MSSEAMSDQSVRLPHRLRMVTQKVGQLIVEDTAGLHPRLHVANMLMRLLPLGVGGARRAEILRAAGFNIGAGTVFHGAPRINGQRTLYEHLMIGRNCVLDVGVTLDLEERLSIGDQVVIGHEVMLLTSSHEIGPKEHRAGAMVRAAVTIGNGAWLGPRCIVLPGVTIGAGAIVSAGALVNKDVPPNTRVAGTPAKVTEELENAL